MRAPNIHPAQIMTATVSSTLGISIITIQRELVSIANQDAWISMLIGGIATIIVSILTAYPLTRMFPEHDLAQIALLVFGKVFGRAVLAFFVFFGLLVAGLSVRTFVLTLRTFLLDRTPIYVIVIFIIFGAVFVISRGINTITGSIDFMFPVFLTPLILILILPYARLDISNLKPVLFQNTSNVMKGAIPAFTSLIGYGILTYFHPYISNVKGTLKYYMGAMFISVFIYVALTAVTIMMFGAEDIKTMRYPTLALSKSIEFPVTLLERLEALIIISWIPGFFAWLMLYSFASARNICELFALKVKHYKIVSYFLVPLTSLIALFPRSGVQASEYLVKTEYLAAIVGGGILPLLCIVGFIKIRRQRRK